MRLSVEKFKFSSLTRSYASILLGGRLNILLDRVNSTKKHRRKLHNILESSRTLECLKINIQKKKEFEPEVHGNSA